MCTFQLPVATTLVQKVLRENGKPLFDSLAKPDTVKKILQEPYFDASQVSSRLVLMSDRDFSHKVPSTR